MSGRFTQTAIRALDALAQLLPERQDQKDDAEHLRTGRKGEEEVYFHLRRLGYVIVARNYRTARHRSELDLIGWDSGTLCFIEVKTRTSRDFLPAEAAVDGEKRRDLARVARAFLRKVPGDTPYRFDIVSVYLQPGRPPEIELFRNAFGMP